MAADGTMKAIIGADNSEYKKVMKDTESTASKTSSGINKSFDSTSDGIDGATKKSGLLNSSIGKIAVGVGAVGLVTKGIDVLKNSVGGAVGRFDTLNAYPKVMKQMGFTTDDTNKSVGILKKGVDGLPTSLQDLTKSAQSFAILEKSATKGAQTATALNDAFLASGASAADASRGVEQYSQMLASGKVDLQGWKTLQETMPYALTRVAKSFGLTGKSAERDLYAKLQSGEITMDQLNKRFVALDGGVNGFAQTARTASGGINTSFTNMKNAVVNGLATTVETINNALKDAGLKNGISTLFDEGKKAIVAGFAIFNQIIKTAIPPMVAVFKTLFDFVNNNKDWLAPLLIGFAAFAGAVKTINAVSNAIKGLQTAFNVVKSAENLGKALSTLGNSSKIAAAASKGYNAVVKAGTAIQAAFNTVMAINPFILIGVAIAAVVAGLVYFFTQTKTGKKVWSDFVKTLTDLWNGIVETAKNVWTSITDTWNSAVESIKNAWSSTKEFFSNIWDGVTSGVDGAVSNVQNAWNSIPGFFSKLWNDVTNTFNSVVQKIGEFLAPAVEVVQNVWNGILAITQPLVDSLTGIWQTVVTTVTGIWNGIVQTATGIWNTLKVVIMTPILLLIDALTGNWNQLVSDAVMSWNKLKEGISQIVSGVVTTVQSYIQGLSDILSSIWTGIKDTAINLANVIKDGVVGAWTAIKEKVVSMATALKDGAISAWNNLKNSVINLANSIKTGTISAWNALKNGVVNAANAVKTGAINAWNALKSGVINTANAIKNGAISAWNGLKSSVVNIANGIKNGALTAWNGLKDGVKNIIDSVINIFDQLKHIDLLAAGRAVIDGFINGLTSAWEKGKEFISGIGDWIRKNKGPISYDKKILIPAGQAIMGGFGKSLNSAFNVVKSDVLTYADQLSGAMNNVSFSGAINKVSDIQSKLQANTMNANTAIAGGANYSSSSLSQEVLNSPSSTVLVEVYQEWDGDQVYTYVKNKDARENSRIKLIKKRKGI
ncbi:tape measure protein [Lactococcus garvieae]|uniref:phage tail protein n=1 Tax=Lactococcus garvieae TaxID=1363 RepID=UPI0032E520BD